MIQLNHDTFIVELNGEFTIINDNDVQLISEFYDEMSPDFLGRIIVKKADKYGVIDLNGTVRIPLIYDEINSKLGAELWLVKSNGLFGAVNINNNTILEPIYDNIMKSFSFHLYICKDKKWGVFSPDGTINIEPIYKDISNSHDDFFRVTNFDHKVGIVDKTGQIIIPLEYDYLDIYLDREKGFEVYISEKNNRYGLLDMKGNVVVDFTYDYLDIFVYETGTLKFRANNKYGLIHYTGKILCEAIYDSIDSLGFSDTYLCKVELDEKVGCINMDGSVILPVEFDKINAV